MHCIRNGILLGGVAAALTNLPLSIILKGLSVLAAPTVCDGIVNMKAFDQLGDRFIKFDKSSAIAIFPVI
jgi:hypothetical protein